MTAPKHTPGPWEVHCGYLIRHVHGDEAAPIAELRAPYRPRVGVVRGHYEQDANARLIATAPELLKELREAESLLDALAPPHSGHKLGEDCLGCDHGAVMRRIRVVIAQAEGRS